MYVIINHCLIILHLSVLGNYRLDLANPEGCKCENYPSDQWRLKLSPSEYGMKPPSSCTLVADFFFFGRGE